MHTLKIGVVGYSGKAFDKDAARELLELGIEMVLADHRDASTVEIVSGLTNVGVPALAYAIAQEKGYQTAGIACEKARKYDCFPVDREVIIGSKWGDESSTFLNEIDVIIRVGGGKQSLAEVDSFTQSGGLAYEYELEAIPVPV